MTDGRPKNCPGVSKLVRPVPDYLECPSCKGTIELWSDEDFGKCYDCGKDFPRAIKDASCLDWCPLAENCQEMLALKKK